MGWLWIFFMFFGLYYIGKKSCIIYNYIDSGTIRHHGNRGKKPRMRQRNELKKDYAYRCIMEMILSGGVKDGRFPSEPEFCRLLHVSRVTLRNALKRLEKEGMILRSHYYGTRINNGSSKAVLIACSTPVMDDYDLKTTEIQAIEEACRQRNIRYEICSPYYLQDAQKLVEKYRGIIFFGAAIRGDEDFIHVIRESALPAVYCREDENNTITSIFPSVGVNIKQAWCAGFRHLTDLGFRRIATLISNDDRTFQRLGFTRKTFAEKIRKDGFDEAAELVFNTAVEEFQETVKPLFADPARAPEAIYCYSDYYASHICLLLRKIGKHIPLDTAVLGFGNGTRLMTPSLASVNLQPYVCGVAALQLLLDQSLHYSNPPVSLDLPYSIFYGDSIATVKLGGLLQKNSIHTRKGTTQ